MNESDVKSICKFDFRLYINQCIMISQFYRRLNGQRLPIYIEIESECIILTTTSAVFTHG